MSGNHAHCIFCGLVQGSADVSICHEDSETLAFMDIQPVNPGHVLVVPREHYESLNDIPAPLALRLFEVALELAPIVRRLTGCDDLNVVVNSGKAAGQDVFHTHVHLIPRCAGDGFDIPLPFPDSAMPERSALEAMAARVIAERRDPARRTAAPEATIR